MFASISDHLRRFFSSDKTINKILQSSLVSPIYSPNEGISYRAMQACRVFDSVEAEFRHKNYITGSYNGVFF